MSLHAYTEDQLVEQPAIALFEEPRWNGLNLLPIFNWMKPFPEHERND
jgi:hypothetical protein